MAKPQERPAVRRVISGALIVLGLALVWWALLSILDQQNPDRVLATVNGEAIYEQDLQAQYARLPPELQAQVSLDDLLNQSVDKLLILQEASERGITVSSGAVDARIAEQASAVGVSVEQLQEVLEEANVSEQEFRDAIREEMVLTRFVEEEIIAEAEVSDAAVLAYYQEHTEEFSAGAGEARVRHVLVDNESLAAEIAERARAGEDFAMLAREYSTGPTGPQGGDLGVVSADTNFVEPFKSVALNLSEGEVSDPVQTRFGWHVIKRTEDTLPFETVAEDIRSALREEEAREDFQGLLARLREEATIWYAEDAEGASLS